MHSRSPGAAFGRIEVLDIPYGPHASQRTDVYLPGGPGPHPVVALLHGGFWRSSHGRDQMRPLALDLVSKGFAVVNLEYRRLGEPGGGWPGTLLDCVAGVEFTGWPTGPAAAADPQGNGHLAKLDVERVAIVGHCAGGHLAVWAAAWLCGLLFPGRQTKQVVVRAVVCLAGVLDLREAARDALDCWKHPLPAAVEFVGGYPDTVDGRYRLGSPIELLPIGREVAQLLLHGEDDKVVPIQQSVRYARLAAAAGDRVLVSRYPGTGHFEMLDPAHESWRAAIAHLREHLGVEPADRAQSLRRRPVSR